MGGKSPFEKIRSLVERRKLFEALIRDHSEILCKGSDESLFYFKPTELGKDDELLGQITVLTDLPRKDMETLGNFTVADERFFFQTELKVSDGIFVLQSNCDIYKLQRRASVRMHLQSSFGAYLSITEFQNRPLYAIAQLADLSAGGVRMFFSDLDSPIGAQTSNEILKMKAGDRFKGVLHVGRNKTFEIKGEVRHIQQGVHHGQIVDQYGVQFVDLPQGMQNRLIAMTFDLQRKIVLGS